GDAFGKVHVDASVAPDRRRLDLQVSVPELQMDLPSTSGRSVQSLEPAPHVVVGAYGTDGRFVALPLHAPQKRREPGSLRVRAVVALGARVRLARDANLDVSLVGAPVVDVTDKASVEGTIHMTRGTVDVFGKRFTIEPASTISFTGDPNAPQLVVTATY